MKKIYLLTILLLFICIYVQGQTCKRKGIIDCQGQCGRFTDKDGDSYCDFSPRSTTAHTPAVEPAKSTPAADTAKLKTAEKKEITPSKATQPFTEKKTQKATASDKAVQPIQPEKTNENSTVDTATISTPISQPAVNNSNTIEETKEKPYALLEITGITLLLYFLSVLMVKIKIYKKATHRKIWNVVLLLTFLMSGILGLVLVAQLNYNLGMSWYMNFLKLHVEFGIAMALISIIHVIWHTSYYLNMLKKKK